VGTLTKKTVLVTGGTGSFGHKFIEQMLKTDVKKIVVYSRDEYKQAVMASELKDERIHFCIGDVRDLQRLKECAMGVDFVVHAAAMKRVETCENNPSEAVKTNILGAQNVVSACMDCGVSNAVNLSADKAVKPSGVYGATKQIAERIFTEANLLGKTKFSSVRYSNVLGSRGSVVEVFKKILEEGGNVTVFGPKAARFFLSQEQVVELVLFALENMRGGEIFVRKSQLIKVKDLADAMKKIIGKGGVKIGGGLREGEREGTILITDDESTKSVIIGDYIVILPPWLKKDKYGGKPAPQAEINSDNSPALSPEQVKKVLRGVML